MRVVRPLSAFAVVFVLALLAGAQESPPAPTIVAGPMVGHVSESAAKIWVQVDRAAVLYLDVREEGTDTWREARWPDGRGRYVRALADTRFAGTLTVTGLDPATRYEVRVREGETILAGGGETSFATAPPPGTPASFRLAFGSCASHWGDDPEQPIFAAVAAARPDLFLFLGDNVYYDRETQEWAHPEQMWDRYEQGRHVAALQGLIRRTPTYAIWDDHDYGPNDSDKIYRFKDLSLDIFRTFWANPAYGSGGSPGVWFRFGYGQVDFFLLDTRFHRDPNDTPDDRHKSQLGAAQRRWLADVLPASTATFKVIVSSGQVLARYHHFESFDRYRHERQWLLDLIREHRIPGVLFLSGDRHLGEILTWGPPEVPYPLYELTSSPLAAGTASGEFVEPDQRVPERLPGSLVLAENFGVIDFLFEEGEEPRLVFEHRDVHGQPAGRRLELTAGQLDAETREAWAAPAARSPQ